MNQDIKLFVSCHKPNVHIPSSKLLHPIQVGASNAETHFPDMAHDDTGDNISDKNPSYCETTGQYWAWKNEQADYFGFFHYRRYFSFSKEKLPIVHEPFIFGDAVLPDNRERNLKRISFDDETIADTVTRFECIAPELVASPVGESIYDQYRHSVGHHVEDIDIALEAARRVSPHMAEDIDEYMNGKQGYFCNMFIMKADLFDGYCTWLFDILEEHEKTRDTSRYPPVDSRVGGYLAERLCGIYLYHLKKSGHSFAELQRVYFRDTAQNRPFASRIKTALRRGR